MNLETSLLDHNNELNKYPNIFSDDPVGRMLYWDAINLSS